MVSEGRPHKELLTAPRKLNTLNFLLGDLLGHFLGTRLDVRRYQCDAAVPSALSTLRPFLDKDYRTFGRNGDSTNQPNPF